MAVSVATQRAAKMEKKRGGVDHLLDQGVGKKGQPKKRWINALIHPVCK